MDDLRKRLRHRVQLTTDGHRPYLVAVREAFEMRIQWSVRCKSLPIAVISFVGYAQCSSVPWGTAVDDHFQARR